MAFLKPYLWPQLSLKNMNYYVLIIKQVKWIGSLGHNWLMESRYQMPEGALSTECWVQHLNLHNQTRFVMSFLNLRNRNLVQCANLCTRQIAAAISHLANGCFRNGRWSDLYKIANKIMAMTSATCFSFGPCHYQLWHPIYALLLPRLICVVCVRRHQLQTSFINELLNTTVHLSNNMQ